MTARTKKLNYEIGSAIVLVVFLLFVLAIIRTAHGQTIVRLPDSVMASVCRIRCSEGGGASSLGSGTLIAKNTVAATVVTVWHLFRDSPQGGVSVSFIGGQSFPAHLLGHDANLDLALLEILGVPSAAAIPIAETPAAQGSRVFSMGYGQQGQFQAQSGITQGYFSFANSNGRGNILQISGAARSGDSGGPMLNDQYEIVGVLFGTDGRVVDGAHCGEVMQFIERCPTGNCTVPRRRVVQQPPLRPVPVNPATNPPPIVTPLAGPQGPPGSAGPVGPPGPAGPAGSDANCADLQAKIDALLIRITELEKRPQSFDLVFGGYGGKEFSPQTINLGGKAIIPPLPVRVFDDRGVAVPGQEEHLPLDGNHELKLQHFPRTSLGKNP